VLRPLATAAMRALHRVGLVIAATLSTVASSATVCRYRQIIMLVAAVTHAIVVCFVSMRVRASATIVGTARLAANRAGPNAFIANAVSSAPNPALFAPKLAFGRAIALTIVFFLPLFAPAPCLVVFPAPSFRATDAVSAFCHVATGARASAEKNALNRTVRNAVAAICEVKLSIFWRTRHLENWIWMQPQSLF
jgi:hypothetical protein